MKPRPMSAATRSTVDLMHITSGRVDLSRNPVDHDDWCARTLDPEATCTCTQSPLFQDAGR